MGIKLLATQARVVKNETDAFIWKVGNGFKMSRKAKKILGIKPEDSGKLGIGFDDDINSLVIKHDNTEGEYNCSVSKQNVIANTGMVETLSEYGSRFKITTEREGIYFRMMIIDDSNTVEEELNETITEEVMVEDEL